eukprot:TRINITY_DN14509_c0_g1_i6.p1 TRINITY_DN14509_c0_g1~~TRINITY_DN14509_c0_g1_i6.p1  ORF type:complete len:418 (+),score=45.45 TRINITY_DN14509_c0_g1_i6:40-1293(+)
MLHIRSALQQAFCHPPTLHSFIRRNGCRFYADGGCSPERPQLERIQRRFARLKKLLDRVCWPRSHCFEALGQKYILPITFCSEQQLNRPCKNELDYLAGFFDGDGCVTAPGDHVGRCALAITQLKNRGEVLLRFQQAFGGSIICKTHGKGSQQPTVEWSIHGQGCRNAAWQLSCASAWKAEQLKIASAWPDCKRQRQELHRKLRSLKDDPICQRLDLSWPYLAGFFDADGHFSISATTGALNLTITQKHPQILECMCAFLQQAGFSLGIHVLNLKEKRHFILTVTQHEVSKSILTMLASEGLTVKKHAAEVALSQNSSCHIETRSKLSNIVGNQARYQRLDAQGCHRAQHILRLKSRLHYYRSVENIKKTAELECQVQDAMEEHKLLKAIASLHLLRNDIRTLLRSGAVLMNTKTND